MSRIQEDDDNKHKFFSYIKQRISVNENYIWLAATLIHERYKDKYVFKSYEEDLWCDKNTALSEDVKKSLNEDIRNMQLLLIEYNAKNQSNVIANLICKISDESFMKSVFRELRELFYEESYTYGKKQK